MAPLLSRRTGLLLVTSFFVPACASHGPGTIDLERLPPYEGRLAELFNDYIEPASFKLAIEQPNLAMDPNFRDRLRAADVVASVRVTTVTVGSSETKSSYALRFEASESFKKTSVEEDLLELRISERNQQPYSVLNTVQTRARGTGIIALWKRFRENNRATVHYYFVPDTPETVSLVRNSLLLEDVK